MPIVDGVKYACQSCIKGHRSSKCTHTNRPLQEIKKKGRPTSQCAHCRELRKTRSVHSRCDCAARVKEGKPEPRILPNGLADAMLLASLADEGDEEDDKEEGTSSGGKKLTTTGPSGVTRLLNPCNCLQGGKCSCCTSTVGGKKPFPGDGASSSSTTGGCCGGAAAFEPEFDFDMVDVEPLPLAGASGGLPVPPADLQQQQQPQASTLTNSKPSCCSPRPALSTPTSSSSSGASLPVLPLLPSLPSLSSSSPSLSSSLPTFSLPSPPIPSDPLFTPSTHGTSSCFCGPTCGCAGCAVHDPLGRKRRSEGGCGAGAGAGEGGGGGCRCGNEGEKGCEASGKGKKARREGGGCCGSKSAPTAAVEEEKRQGGCCGSKKASSSSSSSLVLPRPVSVSKDVSLPALWTLAEEDTGALSPSGGEPTLAPLPSLRTLWPALLAEPPSSSSAAGDGGERYSLGGNLGVGEQLGCAALYSSPDKPFFGPACPTSSLPVSSDEAEGCACSTACGCRSSLLALSQPSPARTVGTEGTGTDADAEGETDDELGEAGGEGLFGEWVKVPSPTPPALEEVEKKEGEGKEEEERMKELEELAAMGMFG
ncbi:hypothetical protein JCM8547_001673 [Rhodosporidiobolus lusitaniae]